MPSVSIILPTYNSQTLQTLDRAITSVQRQTFTDWELLAIDDCSTDGTPAVLQGLAERDRRIRFFRTPENGREFAARNLGLKHARGEMICYLDHDDEFYPDYLETIDRWKKKGDVLFFRYDLKDDDLPEKEIWTWCPDQHFQDMFAFNIAVPFGVAHHRKWFERIGGFHELQWHEGDWDYWKRLVRAARPRSSCPRKAASITSAPEQCPRYADRPAATRPPGSQLEGRQAALWRSHRRDSSPEDREGRFHIAPLCAGFHQRGGRGHVCRPEDGG